MKSQNSLNISNIKIKNLQKEHFDQLFEFQRQLALKTEDKILKKETLVTAFEYILNNPWIGVYYLPSHDQQLLGSTMITYGYDIFTGKTINWFQSVYVDPNFRKQGVFKKVFQNIVQNHHKASKSLKLYVEHNNYIAHQVYEKLGMKRCQEIFLEKDYFFEEKMENMTKKERQLRFQMSVLGNDQVKFKKSDLLKWLNSNLGSLKSVDQEILKNLNLEKQSLIFLVYDEDNNILGYCLALLEISDWRNGINIIFYEFEINTIQLQEMESWLKEKLVLGPKMTCMRFLIEKNDQRKDFLESLNFKDSGYFIYEI